MYVTIVRLPMSEVLIKKPAPNVRAKITLAFLCASIGLALAAHYYATNDYLEGSALTVLLLGCGSFVIWLASFLMALISSLRKDTLAVWALFGCLVTFATTVLTLIFVYR